MRIRRMINAQVTDSHEEEARGMNFSMGNVDTKSKGHGMGRSENRNLEETMRIPRMEELNSKNNNERLMKEQHQNNTWFL